MDSSVDAKELARKKNADRQAKYRKNKIHANGGEGAMLLNGYISTAAHFGIKRLSKHHGITQRELIERLVKEAQDKVLDSFEGIDSPEWKKYFGEE